MIKQNGGVTTVTLQDAIDLFLSIDRAQLTNDNYRHILNGLARAVGPECAIAQVTYAQLAAYLQQGRGRNLKRSTLASYLTVVRTLFIWCQRNRLADYDPSQDLRLRSDSAAPAHKGGIPPAQLGLMLEAARWTRTRDWALLLFITDTACRAGGAASLTLDNLRLDNHSAALCEKGGRWVTAHYGDQTAAAMLAWLSERPACGHAYVFTGDKSPHIPLTSDGMSGVVARYARKVGAFQADGRPYRAHALRHSTAEALVKSGVAPYVVQRKLNHRQLSTTLDHYFPAGDNEIASISEALSLVAVEAPEPLVATPAANVISFEKHR